MQGFSKLDFVIPIHIYFDLVFLNKAYFKLFFGTKKVLFWNFCMMQKVSFLSTVLPHFFSPFIKKQNRHMNVHSLQWPLSLNALLTSFQLISFSVDPSSSGMHCSKLLSIFQFFSLKPLLLTLTHTLSPSCAERLRQSKQGMAFFSPEIFFFIMIKKRTCC